MDLGIRKVWSPLLGCGCDGRVVEASSATMVMVVAKVLVVEGMGWLWTCSGRWSAVLWGKPWR